VAYDVSAEDRNQISQALYAYCRGLDRFDRDLALSPFAADARLLYSGLFDGTASQFMDWIWPIHARMALHVHRVANIFISRESSGDLVSEAYVTTLLRREDGAEYVDRVGYGRYIDRWSATDGHRMTIVRRDYVNDVVSELRNSAVTAQAVPPVDDVPRLRSSRDREDSSYCMFGA
jgi:hypothetical protein